MRKNALMLFVLQFILLHVDHPPGAQGDANYDLLAIQLEHSSSDALAQTTGNAASADSQDVPFYEVTLVDQHFVPSNELTNRTHASMLRCGLFIYRVR